MSQDTSSTDLFFPVAAPPQTPANVIFIKSVDELLCPLLLKITEQ